MSECDADRLLLLSAFSFTVDALSTGNLYSLRVSVRNLHDMVGLPRRMRRRRASPCALPLINDTMIRVDLEQTCTSIARWRGHARYCV
jgi:hypothetical protein